MNKEQKRLPPTDEVVAAYNEFRDHIAAAVHGEHEMEAGAFALIAGKLFGFIFNTYKAIGLLLPERYYEQGSALYRTLWESGANLAWIAKDPETRARQFAEFTAVEFRRLLQSQVNLAATGPTSATAAGDWLREYEALMAAQLDRFRDVSRKGRMRLRDRFSGPSLEALVADLGEPWVREYQFHYKMACFYTHGAPGAVLFPFLVMPKDGVEAFKRVDAERTALLGLLTMDLMQRCLNLIAGLIGKGEDHFLEQLKARLWPEG